eukprot:jgi/Mesen1/4220/ME000219S03352
MTEDCFKLQESGLRAGAAGGQLDHNPEAVEILRQVQRYADTWDELEGELGEYGFADERPAAVEIAEEELADERYGDDEFSGLRPAGEGFAGEDHAGEGFSDDRCAEEGLPDDKCAETEKEAKFNDAIEEGDWFQAEEEFSGGDVAAGPTDRSPGGLSSESVPTGDFAGPGVGDGRGDWGQFDGDERRGSGPFNALEWSSGLAGGQQSHGEDGAREPTWQDADACRVPRQQGVLHQQGVPHQHRQSLRQGSGPAGTTGFTDALMAGPNDGRLTTHGAAGRPPSPNLGPGRGPDSGIASACRVPVAAIDLLHLRAASRGVAKYFGAPGSAAREAAAPGVASRAWGGAQRPGERAQAGAGAAGGSRFMAQGGAFSGAGALAAGGQAAKLVQGTLTKFLGIKRKREKGEGGLVQMDIGSYFGLPSRRVGGHSTGPGGAGAGKAGTGPVSAPATGGGQRGPGAQSGWGRGAREVRPCPFYKKMPGVCVVCAFSEAGHRWLRPVPMGATQVIDGVEVTFIPANHCPGAALILFRLRGGGAGGGRTILHTGDFRACAAMQAYPHLRGARIDSLYLDTTYCNPRYRFPTQLEVIQFVIATARAAVEHNARVMIAVGAYSIGKERVFLAVAQALDVKICVDKRRQRILSSLDWPELAERLTLDGTCTPLHVLPLRCLHPLRLREHMQRYARRFTAALGFRPTGVPYSEHSSFLELKEFVQFLRPGAIIPTVNVGRAAERERMQALFTLWIRAAQQNPAKAAPAPGPLASGPLGDVTASV